MDSPEGWRRRAATGCGFAAAAAAPLAAAYGRLGLNTAFCLCSTGLAVALAGRATRWGRPTRALSLASALVAGAALLGHLYRVSSFYRLATQTPMPAGAAGALLAVDAYLFFLEPQVGVVRLLRDRGAAGLAARRLLPAALGLPVLLGWLRVLGEGAGWFDADDGTALLVAVYVVILSALVWRLAARMARAEDLRRVAAEQLRAAAQVKADFAAMVSHELRTPLTSVKMGLDLITDGSCGPVNDEQREYLGVAKRNVDRLTRLIKEVLDFQRLESGRLEFRLERRDVGDLVREAADAFRPSAERKGLRLELRVEPELPPVTCDGDKITQVVYNLLSNALKFTERGAIRVAVGRTRAVGGADAVRVSVRDDGPGIAPKDQALLFRSFVRLSSKVEGAGLGLAISHRIVERHGGLLAVDSAPGRGSCFYFELPLAPSGALPYELANPSR